MARNLPNGRRVYVKPKIGGKNRPCRMKAGTAKFLGLEVAPIEKGKGSSIKRGAMGTATFTLILQQRFKVGGAVVSTLAHPVPGDVKVTEFYNYAKNYGRVAGIRTPDGISYYWKDVQTGIAAAIPDIGNLPNPFDAIDVDDVGDIVDAIGDLAKGRGLGSTGLDLLGDILLD